MYLNRVCPKFKTNQSKIGFILLNSHKDSETTIAFANSFTCGIILSRYLRVTSFEFENESIDENQLQFEIDSTMNFTLLQCGRHLPSRTLHFSNFLEIDIKFAEILYAQYLKEQSQSTDKLPQFLL